MQISTALAVVMRAVSILLFLIFDLSPVARAQTDTQNFFINPTTPGPNQAFSANPTWDIGSTQTIRWSSDYENFSVNLWQQDLGFERAANGPGPTIFSKAKTNANYDQDADQFDWVVQTYNFALSESDVFFMWLTTPGDESMTSHYFNISNEATSSSLGSSVSDSPSTSISISSATSTPPSSSPASGTSSSEDSPPVPATNPNQTGSDVNGLTNGAKVGIGVGASFGGAILLVLSAVLVLMLKKRKKRHQSPPPPFISDGANRSFPSKRPPQAQSQELDDNQTNASTEQSKAPSWQRVELE